MHLLDPFNTYTEINMQYCPQLNKHYTKNFHLIGRCFQYVDFDFSEVSNARKP